VTVPGDDGSAPDDGLVPAGMPPDVARRLLRAIDRAPSTFVTLIDEDMRSRWLSRSASWVTGTDPDARPGRDALERIHPDDVERLLHGLDQLQAARPDGDGPAGTRAGGPGSPLLEPLRYRIRRPDDTYVTVESWVQDLLHDPEVNGLLVFGRPVGGAIDGVGQVVDLLVADAPLPQVFSACAQLVPWFIGTAAVVGLLDGPAPGRGDGEPQTVVGPALDERAERLAVDERWWRPTVEDGKARIRAGFADFAPDLADRARAEGFRSAWTYPIRERSSDEVVGCVVVWALLDVELNVGTEDGLRHAARLAMLVVGEQRRQAALRRQALTDPLTGLGNREALRRRLDEATGPLTLALLDLDAFKPVNDTHGHEVGDRVLQVVGQRLLGTVRDRDLVARFGGDEFAVVFADEMSPEGVAATAARLRAAVAGPITLPGGPTVHVGISIGVATAAAADVVPLADRALYEAKGVWPK
jgi:diguanylate cyclase (GGDEF)-like protein